MVAIWSGGSPESHGATVAPREARVEGRTLPGRLEFGARGRAQRPRRSISRYGAERLQHTLALLLPLHLTQECCRTSRPVADAEDFAPARPLKGPSHLPFFFPRGFGWQ